MNGFSLDSTRDLKKLVIKPKPEPEMKWKGGNAAVNMSENQNDISRQIDYHLTCELFDE